LHVHLPREPVYHHRGLTAAESARIVSTIETCSGEPAAWIDHRGEPAFMAPAPYS